MSTTTVSTLETVATKLRTEDEVVIPLAELGIIREESTEMKFLIWYNRTQPRRGFYIAVQPQISTEIFTRCMPMNGTRAFLHSVNRLSPSARQQAGEQVTADLLARLISQTK